MDEWPTLQSKLIKSLQDASQLLIDSFGISKEQQRQTLTNISNQSVGNILVIIRNTVSASAVSLVMMILIPVYVVLVLYYRSYWVNVLFHLFPGEKEDEIREMVSRVVGTYYNFIKGMALVYLIVGSLNSIGLLILGVPHAILFGFIASILTFVPYVGIMVGSLLPITISWATYNSIWYPIGVIGIFSFVQYLEANIIFPIAVSSRLNVNSLVMLVAIFLGGILWGMAGMILFVPFVGIIKLIADHNPKWRVGSVILGADDSQKKFRGKMKR
ncbi:hypothetical protein WSM22_41560 [Cytophagales bacterium WSM2-2]|nr:hypothetical protein WSM22_41560 [Cytophagales bacterium WSM2-2]